MKTEQYRPEKTTRGPRLRKVILPTSKWPKRDRDIWQRAKTRTSATDRNAPLAKLAPSTIVGREKTYGSFLSYLKSSGSLNVRADPADRMTPDVLQDYLSLLYRRLAASSIKEELNRLTTTMTVLAPEKDWGWIRTISSAPSRGEVEASKKRLHVPDPAIVLQAALASFDQVSGGNPGVRACTTARNALIVAFAALFALRRKNLTEIERGVHLLEDGSTTRLAFDETLKNKTGILFDVPAWMMPRFERYLDKIRPVLLGTHADRQALWISQQGKALSPITVGMIFANFGDKHLEHHLNCHILRHAMATTIIVHRVGGNDLAAAALGHKTVEMVDTVYSEAASVELSKVWQRRLRARKHRLGLSD